MDCGVAKKGSARLAAQVEAVLSLPVLALEPGVEQACAEIQATLESAGRPIGAYDLSIAAHARSLKLTLVTEKLVRRAFARLRLTPPPRPATLRPRA